MNLLMHLEEKATKKVKKDVNDYDDMPV